MVKTRRFVTRGSERIADYVLSIFDCIPDNCRGYKSITTPDKDKIVFGIGYMYSIMYRNVYCFDVMLVSGTLGYLVLVYIIT